MKKYLLFLILLIIPVVVFAAGDVTVSSTSLSVAPKGKVNFNIVATNSAGKVTISSSDTSIVVVDKSNEWVEKGTLTVTATGKKTGNAKIIVVVDAATFDKEVIKKTYTINVRVKSTNDNLAGLSLSSGNLSPAFSASNTNYTATVNAGNVTINAVKGESLQKISGTGAKKLAYGKNTFKVIATSEAGNKKTYTIVITRPDNRSTNNYLKSLNVSNGNIAFKNGSTKYNLDLDSNVTSLKVDATLEDSKASFVSGYGPRTVGLNYGANNVLLKVKAENESVRTYTIIVNRKDDRSKNNYLKSLTISDGALTFSKETLEYNVSVPFDKVRVDVNAIAEDDKSKVVVNNIDLNIGTNVITVLVTAENESVRTYKINVNRLAEAAKMSDNNNVSTIDIIGHDFDFVKDVFEYDITLTNEDKLHFFVELEDEKANYVIDGNENLKDGSVVKVISTSESGEKKEYKFNVSMKESDNKFCNKCLLCGIIGFGLGVIVTILIFFIIKKVNKKKNTIKEDIIVPKDNSVMESNAIVSGEAEMPKTSVDTEQSFYDNNY